MRARIEVTVFATLILLTNACQYDPYTHDYAVREPNRSRLVGTWRATSKTLEELSGGPYASLRPRIEIGGDGTIRLMDIPDTWRSRSREGVGKADAFTGRWELGKHQNKWWGLTIRDSRWTCSGCLMVLRDSRPHRLVLGYDDPDMGRGYEFEVASVE